MKRWLIILVAVAVAIRASSGAVFALTGDGSGNEDPDVADEWKLVEASGWTGGFSLRLPRGWQLNELQGIDSYVGEIVGGGARLTFDYGWYSGSLVDDDDPQYIVTYEEIGGRGAKLVIPRGEGEGRITGVYFEDFDGSDFDIPSQNRLQISGVDLTPDQQETALAIFRTIRPLASDSGGDRVVTSIDDIDPNECNGIHNINACTPEELEELGRAPVAGPITVGELRLETEVEVTPELLFEDGEPQYEVQSHEEAVNCGLAGGTVYDTSDGKVDSLVKSLCRSN